MFDSIIVVTDRKVLDKQLQRLIQSLIRVQGVVKPVEGTSKELRKYLESGNDIIISTIQKFPFISKAMSSLGNRKFAVIIDEVHSSQNGKSAQSLKKVLSKDAEGNKEEVEEISDEYEDLIQREIQARMNQKNISFFGFTGTPKNKTLEIFGRKYEDGTFRPFHTYTMKQRYTKFTLNVLNNFTSYDRFLRLNNPEEDIETQSKAARRKLDQIDRHPKNLSSKASIILDHFINISSKEINGQARGMIVVKSRAQCVRFFKEINKQLNDRGIKYRALVAFSDEVELEEYPDERFTEEKLNATFGMRGDIPRLLKHPNFRLLIVSNKYQTGFDEPLLQSMYVDKKGGCAMCSIYHD